MSTEYPNSNYPGAIDDIREPNQPELIPLSQTGSGNLNHVEHHAKLGDAVASLQLYAAQRSHDHSGDGTSPTRGAKLAQANTHQNPDTDTARTALHHTLGTGANQAAAGNHTHDFNDLGNGGLLNAPFLRCTSTTRPTPSDGLTIFETDTNRMRVYADFGQGNGARWNILPTANIPIVRLAQGAPQAISSSTAGTTVAWTEEIEDNFGYFNPSSATNTFLTITEPGLYHVNAAIQWNSSLVPDVGTVVFCIDGTETLIRHTAYQRSGLLAVIGSLVGVPDPSQTLSASGNLRLGAGQRLTVKARHASGGILNQAVTLFNSFDGPSQVKSRLELHYVGP